MYLTWITIHLPTRERWMAELAKVTYLVALAVVLEAARPLAVAAFTMLSDIATFTYSTPNINKWSYEAEVRSCCEFK